MNMKKLLTNLPAVLVMVSLLASPAFAQKRSEYNFNTCNYNFYGNANPMNGQGAGGGPVSFYKGVGQTANNAEKLRTGINAAVYSQTPQRTKVWDQMGYNKKKATYQPQQQIYVPQQQQSYAYTPGQNSKTQSGQSSVGYQYNNSGLATYDSSSATTTTKP